MKCFNHPSKDAVAACVDCGKSLCKECASKWNPVLCDRCAQERTDAYNAEQEAYKDSMKGSIIKSIILFVVGFVVFMAMYGQFNVQAFGMGYIFAGFPYGWRALNKITPDVFLILPLVGWIIFFIVKFFLALFVGAFVMPVKIIGTIFKIRKMD